MKRPPAALPAANPRTDAVALRRACMECRRQVEPDWQFCAHCETRLDTRCPRCDVPLPPAGARRCGHCGLVLQETGSVS